LAFIKTSVDASYFRRGVILIGGGREGHGAFITIQLNFPVAYCLIKLLRFLTSEDGISNIATLFFMISPSVATPISVHRLVEG
jgi:hypothetical protein